jgi:ABC-type sugar transport system ATPase subunit
MISPAAATQTTGDHPLLEVRGVTKSFPEVRALDRVAIHAMPGEIIGLVGENGAGKSTLMKIVAGLQAPDEGVLLWNGEEVKDHSPRHAVRRGIEFIPQELSLAADLSVAENLFIGHAPSRFGFIRSRELTRKARELSDRLELRVDVRRIVGSLSPHEKRLVMLGRALARNAKLLILDEPTVTLQEAEISNLLNLVGKLRDEGVTVLYVSHRLDEVLALTDRTTVMRDGRIVTTRPTAELNKREMVALIVGRALADIAAPSRTFQDNTPRLEVRHLSCRQVDDVSFVVRPGEIVGLAGLVGSGRTEIARCIFGADPRTSGEIWVDGELRRIRTPRDAIRAGVVLLPEDRRNQGILGDLSIVANVSLPSMPQFGRFRTFVRQRLERRTVESYTRQLTISAGSLRRPIRYLSGGNQQKALLAKWLMTEATIYVLDEPTVGIDVGAKREIYGLIGDLASRGNSVVLISTEFEELVGLADRVVVIAEGRVVGEVTRGEGMSERAILHLCYGHSADDRKSSGD